MPIKKGLSRLVRPVSFFIRTEASSGIILAFCAALALIIANSPLSESYFHLLHVTVIGLSLQHWINDGLMAIFFFVIGLEIKKEMLIGELSSIRKAALPVAAALGGMIIPALIYFYFNRTGPSVSGWGIPMATDIAFAIGILTLFSNRVPLSLKIFLLALAIVDDLGAVVVIALFYTNEIRMIGLLLAVVVFALIFVCRRLHVRNYLIYIALGFIAWCGVYYSGVHSTIAGVILGFLTPLNFPLKKGSETTYSPLGDLMRYLHPWVSFLIMPLFALANAGINLQGIDFQVVYNSPIFQGITLGLLIGKPLGIFIFSYLATLFRVAVLPGDLKWLHILGTSFLGGIGFTMALFISALSLGPGFDLYSKTAIITGSLLSAVIGSIILAVSLKPSKKLAA